MELSPSVAEWATQEIATIGTKHLARAQAWVDVLEETARAVRLVLELHEDEPAPPGITGFWERALRVLEDDLHSLHSRLAERNVSRLREEIRPANAKAEERSQ